MKKLTFKEIITVASMLFGMFFGAGNLIFPASMGQLAGRNMWMAAAGFLITGVGLPLLGVAALGISRRDGLFELASRVGGPSYRIWAVGFCVLSFVIANLGLDAIIAWSLPVLMFLYPVAIALILLTLGGRFFANDPLVLRFTLGFTAAAALFDFLSALPDGIRAFLHADPVIARVQAWLPLASQGFGWICPALLGLAIGLIVRQIKQRKTRSANSLLS